MHNSFLKRRERISNEIPLAFIYLFYFIYSFFNVDNYRTNTVYNKRNSNKMLIDVKTLVKKPIDYNTLKKK